MLKPHEVSRINVSHSNLVQYTQVTTSNTELVRIHKI